MILQGVVVQNGHGLGVALKHTGDAHVTRSIELLDAGDQARSLSLDGHVAVLEHALDGQGVAFLLHIGGVGDLGQVQLLSDLRTDLSGITIDSLTAAEDDVVVIETDGVESGGKDLGGGVSIGTAELTGRNEIAVISAHGHQLAQHTFCRRGTHGDDGDLAAQLILELESGLNGVHIIGVDDGLHGSAVQGTIGIDGNLTGGIGDLLNANKNLHYIFTSFFSSHQDTWQRPYAGLRKCPRRSR